MSTTLLSRFNISIVWPSSKPSTSSSARTESTSKMICLNQSSYAEKHRVYSKTPYSMDLKKEWEVRNTVSFEQKKKLRDVTAWYYCVVFAFCYQYYFFSNYQKVNLKFNVYRCKRKRSDHTSLLVMVICTLTFVMESGCPSPLYKFQ